MPESMHERYDRDERRLLETAADELWTDALVDDVVDVAAEIFHATAWRGVPDDAPERWVERATAIQALASMAIRTTRTAALTVRAGYAAEALADLRRLLEASGHARRVATDASGQYAENWMHGRGQAGKPRAAFSPHPEDAQVWKLMSDQSHADFASHTNHSGMMDEHDRMIHGIGPKRDPFWDSIWLWVVARQFVSVLACVVKVRSHAEDGPLLACAQRIVDAGDRVEAEVSAR